VRFKTYIPFSQYQPPDSTPCQESPATTCRKPQSFVLLESRAGLAKDVVIFGVVDPRLSDYVGLLISTGPSHDKYRTRVAVKTQRRLEQIDAYFEQKYRMNMTDEASTGIKVFGSNEPTRGRGLGRPWRKIQVILSAQHTERASIRYATSMKWREAAAVQRQVVHISWCSRAFL